MSPNVRQMTLEQYAERICTAKGIDYHAISDSKKQPILMQACNERTQQTKGGN
jgi:hypothetical protein